jgi:Ca2+-binding EF-hand superfamily protein
MQAHTLTIFCAHRPTMSRRHRLTVEQVAEFKRAFSSVDNGQGRIGPQDVANLMREHGYYPVPDEIGVRTLPHVNLRACRFY